MPCLLCQQQKCSYNMNSTCCQTRFLKSETSRERRTTIREYWKAKMKPEAYAELVAAIKREKW